MKIKLALLDSDQNYLNRIVTAFNIKYADKLEIYSFTKLESAMAALEPSRIDVLVASDTFVVESSALPKRCQLAYFVESADVDSVNDQRAICKFQKADLIYRQILSIYSEYAGSASGLKLGDDSCKVIAFTSPCGGVGSSTMAAACALHYAARGKRTLYLNFERFGSSDAFFAAEGQFDMSGIIFALKSKKTNLSMKMESCVKQDPRGVYFYSQSKVALDMLELGADDYLPKPFHLAELSARIRSVLRRHRHDGRQSLDAGNVRLCPGTTSMSSLIWNLAWIGRHFKFCGRPVPSSGPATARRYPTGSWHGPIRRW